MDGVIISGYPGTIISTWQQAGRAGRGTEESIAVLVAFQNPLDQYFMNHPEMFFGRPHEHAIVDLSNPYIVSGHLLCAASEIPVGEDDTLYFGDRVKDFLKPLEVQMLVHKGPGGWVYSGKARATEVVSLDNIPSEIFRVICDGELLETMDKTQACREAHEGAVLLHQGETYIVEKMDLTARIVQVKKADVDYYTEAMKVVDVGIVKEVESRRIGNIAVSLGEVNVSERYIGYKIKKENGTVGIRPLNLPLCISGQRRYGL